MVTQTYDTRSEIWGPFLQNLVAQKHEILVQFRTTLRLDHEYLWNTTKHRQSENGIANNGHSHTGQLNLVYFGPQTAKNKTRVLTHPPAIVQRTGVKKSVAFARRQQQAAIKLGIATYSCYLNITICSTLQAFTLICYVNPISLTYLLTN